MAKYLANPSTYTFSASARTLTFISSIPARQGLILSVARAKGGLLYQPQQGGTLYTGTSDFGGTWISPTLTFNQDTTAYGNSDDLEVFLDDGATATLATLDADLGTIGTSPPTLPGTSTGVQGLLRWLGQSAFQLGAGVVTSITQRVTLATDGQAATAIGAAADSQATDDTGTWSLVAMLKRLSGKFALGPQAPSAALAVNSAGKINATGTAGLSALNTDLLTGGASGWLDVSGYQYGVVTVLGSAGISAGQIQFYGTDNTTLDPSGAILSVANGISATSVLGVGPYTISANAIVRYGVYCPFRFICARVTTAFVGGTVQALYSLTQAVPAPLSLLANIAQVGGTTTTGLNANSSGVNALAVAVVGPCAAQDYSGQNVAAASGSLAINISGSNGPSVGFVCSLTAWTAGSSLGLDLFLEVSLNNGGSWIGYWQCEALTGVGSVYIPALPIPGRRRIRWVNRGGAATTATLDVASISSNAIVPPQRQFFDRTSGVGSGTVTAATQGAVYDIAGLKNVCVKLNAGTATTNATFRALVSDNGVDFVVAGPTVAVVGLTASTTLLPLWAGATGRFLRIDSVAAGTSQVMNYIAINAN